MRVFKNPNIENIKTYITSTGFLIGNNVNENNSKIFLLRKKIVSIQENIHLGQRKRKREFY